MPAQPAWYHQPNVTRMSRSGDCRHVVSYAFRAARVGMPQVSTGYSSRCGMLTQLRPWINLSKFMRSHVFFVSFFFLFLLLSPMAHESFVAYARFAPGSRSP